MGWVQARLLESFVKITGMCSVRITAENEAVKSGSANLCMLIGACSFVLENVNRLYT